MIRDEATIAEYIQHSKDRSQEIIHVFCGFRLLGEMTGARGLFFWSRIRV
jgi:hypothetical protein